MSFLSGIAGVEQMRCFLSGVYMGIDYNFKCSKSAGRKDTGGHTYREGNTSEEPFCKRRAPARHSISECKDSSRVICGICNSFMKNLNSQALVVGGRVGHFSPNTYAQLVTYQSNSQVLAHKRCICWGGGVFKIDEPLLKALVIECLPRKKQDHS